MQNKSWPGGQRQDFSRGLGGELSDAAVAAGGDPKEIAHAQMELARAQDEFDRGRPDHAINHYKHAWDHAENAIGKAAETDEDEPSTEKPRR